MSTLRNLVKSEAKTAMVYVGTSALNQLASFILIPFYWQKLTPEDYGVIAITEIIGRLMACFYGLELGMAITRFYYEWREDERKRRLGAVWMAHWGSTLVLGGLSVLLFWPLSPALFPSVPFFPYLFLGIVVAVLNSLQEIINHTLRIKKLPLTFAAFNLSGFFIRVFCSVLFVVILDRKLQGYFEGLILGNLVVVLISAGMMFFYARPCLRRAGLREAVAFTLPIIWANLLNKVAAVSDRFMLQYFASLEVLGIYAVSMKFAMVLGQFHNAIKMSFVPFLFKTISEDPEKGRSLVSRMSVIYFLPLAAAGLLISVFIRDFVLIIDRPAYFPVIDIVPLVVGAQLLLSSYLYFAPGLLLAKKTRLLWIASMLRALIFVGCGPFLVMYYQLPGMIACLYLATAVYIWVSFYMSQKHFHLPVRLDHLLLLAVTYTALVLGSYWIELQPVWLDILVKGAVCSVICFAAMRIFLLIRRRIQR